MPDQLSLFTIPTPEPTPPAEEPAPKAAAPSPPAPLLSAHTPLSGAIEQWCAQLAADGKSPHTVIAFGADLRLFALETESGARPLNAIATADLNGWLHQQQTVKNISPKSYSRRVTSLKSFFRWLTETHILAADPAAPVIQHSVLSPLPAALTPAQAEVALTMAQKQWAEGDPLPYVLLGVLLKTGIKKGECLDLEPGDIALDAPEGPELLVRAPASQRFTARYKERKLRLGPDTWVQAYQAYLPQRETYITERRARKGDADPLLAKLFPWSPRRLEYVLEAVGKAAGIAERISFDLCRWTCAVLEVHAGVEENTIRQKLGLSKIQWREIGMKLRKLTERPL